MRQDVERPWLMKRLENGYEHQYHPSDPKTVEISPGLIDVNSLSLEKPVKRWEARARTKDGRVVEYSNFLSRQDLAEVKRGNLDKLEHFISHSGHFIVDENARVEGPELWRRGRNLDEVKIVTAAEQEERIKEYAMCKIESATSAEADFWFLMGVWEVVNPDDSINPDIKQRFEDARLK